MPDEVAAPTGEEEEPPPPHKAGLSFAFDFSALPPPPPPPEGEEPPPAPPGLDGTFFSLTVGPPAAAGEEAAAPTFELAHPLSGEEAPESSTAELEVTEAFVRWLVVEAQGVLSLSLRRKGPAEGGDPGAASHEVCALPFDVAGLIFGKSAATAVYDTGPPPPSYYELKPSKRPPPPLPLPEAAAALASRLSVTATASEPLLPEPLAHSLNPMMVTVVRAEGLPPDFSGDNRRPGSVPGLPTYRAPYEELVEECAPVSVRWRLLGASHATRGLGHAPSLRWDERKLLLAGELGAEELQRRLRDEEMEVEVRDRDPKLPEPPPAPAEPEPEPPPSKGGGSKKDVGKGKTPPPSAPAAAPPAPAPAVEPEVEQPPPCGVARAKLGELLPKCSTQRYAYAPKGAPEGTLGTPVPVAASRRLTLTLNVTPCERPREKPPPEAEVIPYYPGKYVEHGTCVSLKLELARPLPFLPAGRAATAATDHAQTDELQRMVALIKYNDTPALLALQNVLEDVNTAAGMQSASAWETYKDEWREELDIVSGVQLVDSEVRLFLLEGQAALFDEDGTARNAMARLGALLARAEPNSPTSLTLADTHLLFPRRLYNSFETPVKLIKVRAPLPSLLRRPELYQHARVKLGCQAALLALGGLLRASSIRLAHKNGLFPLADDLLQMEKKYAAVILPHDREGVPMESDSESLVSDEGGGAKTHRSHHRHRRETRKAATDHHNAAFLAALAERPYAEAPDYVADNKLIPPPPPRAPLPEWYLASIPVLAEGEQVYAYSGQRLNHTERQNSMVKMAVLVGP